MDVYFVANTACEAGSATYTFKILGMQPDLWDLLLERCEVSHNLKSVMT